jgi:hypothetical protein
LWSQVPWRLDRALAAEVARGGADHALRRRQLAHDQRGIVQLADADLDVDVLVDQIDRVVGQQQVDLDPSEGAPEQSKVVPADHVSRQPARPTDSPG